MKPTNKVTSLMLGGLCGLMLVACNEDEAQLAQASSASGSGRGTPREVCTEQVITTQKPVKDKDRVIGTVTGAVAGAVIGNEVGGKGTSQDIATVAGAAAGGYAGNRVQKSIQEGSTEKTTERVCRTVYE